YVEGRVRYRNYDDKKGIRRQVTEIYVDSLEWLATSKKNEVSNVGTDDPLPLTDNIDNFK
ncbi:MAG: single-stranded DNA-binding protein, partial [Prevotella pallens]|nr:single-stranded DNA-binding protein [Prevotella pallens]